MNETLLKDENYNLPGLAGFCHIGWSAWVPDKSVCDDNVKFVRAEIRAPHDFDSFSQTMPGLLTNSSAF